MLARHLKGACTMQRDALKVRSDVDQVAWNKNACYLHSNSKN